MPGESLFNIRLYAFDPLQTGKHCTPYLYSNNRIMGYGRWIRIALPV